MAHALSRPRRRPLILVILVVGGLALVAGCGGSGTAASPTSPTPSASGTAAAEPGGSASLPSVPAPRDPLPTDPAGPAASAAPGSPALPRGSAEPRPPRARPTSALPKTPPTDLSGYDSPGFTLPSGNIGCLFDDSEAAHVRCDRQEYTSVQQRRPAQCHGDWGHSVGLTVGSRARAGCISDTVLGVPGETDGSRTLPYGDSVRYRGIVCTSTETGVRCATSGGHGFQLSRSVLQVR